jgi:hypothetical protein
MVFEQNLEIIKELERVYNLQLTLVRINTVEAMPGCTGMGCDREERTNMTRSYLGILDIKMERYGAAGNGEILPASKVDMVTLFDEGMFVNLHVDEPIDHITLNGLLKAEYHSKKFSVSASDFDKMGIVIFGDYKEFHRKLLAEDCRIRRNLEGYENLPHLVSINVFAGDSSILYDYIVNRMSPFSARKTFTSLGLPINQKLKEGLEKGAVSEIIGLFNEHLGPNRADKLRGHIAAIKKHGMLDLAQRIELIGGGVTINVPVFVDNIEKELEKSKARS